MISGATTSSIRLKSPAIFVCALIYILFLLWSPRIHCFANWCRIHVVGFIIIRFFVCNLRRAVGFVSHSLSHVNSKTCRQCRSRTLNRHTFPLTTTESRKRREEIYTSETPNLKWQSLYIFGVSVFSRSNGITAYSRHWMRTQTKNMFCIWVNVSDARQLTRPEFKWRLLEAPTLNLSSACETHFLAFVYTKYQRIDW